jgi:hypothetical protein
MRIAPRAGATRRPAPCHADAPETHAMTHAAANPDVCRIFVAHHNKV